ncbi:DUF4383 domain-containing protein [Amycolatopsis sp. NPDC059657]|uniref:DUF4383 domain-containing protein n=1 Tax=Amycolatopsis sp. NPDC059657 TaxID=3346899 RepID=UPI00367213F6
MTLPRSAALVIGVVYLALGVLGFLLAPDPTALNGHQPSNTVWIFSVGLLQNALHITIGLLGLVAARKSGQARLFGLGAFFVFTAVTAYGIVAAIAGFEGDAALNANWPDNILHALTAVAGLAIAQPTSRAPQNG